MGCTQLCVRLRAAMPLQAVMKGCGPLHDVDILNVHHGNVRRARLSFAVISKKLLISIKFYKESEDCGLTSCGQLLVVRIGAKDFSAPLYRPCLVSRADRSNRLDEK
jgi:hypothetical protein